MCFSAEASFVSGVIISGIGVIALKKVKEPSKKVFASIPLLFGFQQIAEGFVWLSLLYPQIAFMQNISTYSFLIMAQLIWPSMIPLSIYLMEKNSRRKKILNGFLLLGLFLSGYYAYCLLSYKIDPQILECHVKYVANYPKSLKIISFSIYLLVTIVPLFISSIKRIYLLGVLMFLACIVSVIFFKYYVTSVWCFFAAIISIIILYILNDPANKPSESD